MSCLSGSSSIFLQPCKICLSCGCKPALLVRGRLGPAAFLITRPGVDSSCDRSMGASRCRMPGQAQSHAYQQDVYVTAHRQHFTPIRPAC